MLISHTSLAQAQTRLCSTSDKRRLGLPGHCCFALLPPLIPYFVCRQGFAAQPINAIPTGLEIATVVTTGRDHAYYVPPELVLRPDPMPVSEFKRKRFDWWIERLRAAMAGELARKQATETVREREELVQLLLDSTAEAIYGIDLHGNCMLANPTCARLLGYADSEQLNGQNMHTLIHHHRPDGLPYPEEECPIVRAIQTRQGIHVKDEVFWRADGTKFDAEYFAYPMWRGKELIGAVVTVGPERRGSRY